MISWSRRIHSTRKGHEYTSLGRSTVVDSWTCAMCYVSDVLGTPHLVARYVCVGYIRTGDSGSYQCVLDTLLEVNPIWHTVCQSGGSVIILNIRLSD